jgi:hypothetical protein
MFTVVGTPAGVPCIIIMDAQELDALKTHVSGLFGVGLGFL